MSLFPNAELAVHSSIRYAEDKYPEMSHWGSIGAWVLLGTTTLYLFAWKLPNEIRQDRARDEAEALKTQQSIVPPVEVAAEIEAAIAHHDQNVIYINRHVA